MKTEVFACCLAGVVSFLLAPFADAQAPLPLLRKQRIVRQISGRDDGRTRASLMGLSEEEIERDQQRALHELLNYMPSKHLEKFLNKDPSRQLARSRSQTPDSSQMPSFSLSPSPSPFPNQTPSPSPNPAPNQTPGPSPSRFPNQTLSPSPVIPKIDIVCEENSFSHDESFSYSYGYSFSFPSLVGFGACPESTAFDPLSKDDPEVEEIMLSPFSLFEIALPFDFDWLGQTHIAEGSAIGISHAGEIIMFPQVFFGPRPGIIYPVGILRAAPRIAFFNSLLEIPSEGGEVLVKSSPSSLLVSFQNIILQAFVGGGIGNAQVELFPSGHVSICYGGGIMNEFVFVAGLEDFTLDIVVAPNNTDVGFETEIGGVTFTWPECYCFCYDPTRDNTMGFPAPTPAPTSIPTAEVTCPPTASPEYSYSFSYPEMSMSFSDASSTTSSCSAETAFVPLKNGEPGVEMIFLGDDDVYQLEIPFDFNFMGSTLFPEGSRIGISSNGQLHMEPWDVDSFCCLSPLPIAEGLYRNPRIAFAQADLDPSRQGQVLVRSLPSSLLVSFQGVPWFGYWGINQANVQTELFPNGRVEICYGVGSVPQGRSFVAGLEYHEENKVVPVTIAELGFDQFGETQEWPSCFCYCYEAESSPIVTRGLV